MSKWYSEGELYMKILTEIFQRIIGYILFFSPYLIQTVSFEMYCAEISKAVSVNQQSQTQVLL